MNTYTIRKQLIKSLHITGGDFDIYGIYECQLQSRLIDYIKLVEETTHVGEALLDHIYIKNTIWERFVIDVLISNIYFSDHDAVRVKLSNKKNRFSNYAGAFAVLQ